MADATCETCPWWVFDSNSGGDVDVGYCHHVSATNVSMRFATSWWCSEHPLRQRDRIAEVAVQGLLAYSHTGRPHNCAASLARAAYEMADAMLAERAKGAP